MDTLFKKRQGILGENAAVEYLRKKGYKIIDRNFRIRNGEIDIVALHKNTLIFTEVKTRSSYDFGAPLEAITPWKIKYLIRAAQFYKISHPNLPDVLRIDAISVTLGPNREAKKIEHIENITGY